MIQGLMLGCIIKKHKQDWPVFRSTVAVEERKRCSLQLPNELILNLVIDAKKWKTGGKEAETVIERISNAASSSGMGVAQFSKAFINMVKVFQSQGELGEKQAENLIKLVSQYRELEAAIGRISGERATALTQDLANAKFEAQQFRGELQGIDLKGILEKGDPSSFFAQMVAGVISVKTQLADAGQVLRNVFDKPIGGDAVRSFKVFQELGMVLRSLSGSSQAAFYHLGFLKTAIEDLGTSGPQTSKALNRISDIQKQLASSEELSREKTIALRSELEQLTATLFNLTRAQASSLASKELEGLSAQQVRDMVAARERELISVQKLTKAERDRLKTIIETSNLTRDLARIGGQGEGAVKLAVDLSSFERAVRTTTEFRDAINKTSKSLPEAYIRIETLKAVLDRYDNSAIGAVKVTEEFATVLNTSLTGLGVQLKAGDRLSIVLDAIRAKYTSLETAIGQVSKEVKGQINVQQALGKQFKNFDQLMSIAIDKIIRYRVAFYLMRQAVQSFRDAIKTFQEVEHEIAQIEKVIEPVGGQLDKLRDRAYNLAIDFGTSVQDVLKTMKIFAQQGKTFNEILDLTQTTLLAVNAANLETEQAVEALTAITKAYRVEANELIGVLDKLTNIQAKHAVTAQDLADAIKLIAAAGVEVGLSMDELLGQVTAIATVTRKSGKAVAQSLKTIFARFERNETVEELEAIGIAVQGTDGTIRNLMEVLTELRGSWDTLTDAQKFAISQTVAGVRRYTDFLVLMNNFGEAIAATKDGVTAQGVAIRNNVIEMKTFTRQIEVFRATLQKAFQNIAETGLADLAAGVIEIGRGVLSLVSRNEGLARFTATFANIIALLLVGKGLSVGLNIAFGKLNTVLLQTIGPAVTLGGSLAGVSEAQKEARTATALHSVTIKEAIPLIWAMIRAQKAQVLVGSELIVVNERLAGTQGAVAAATGASSTQLELFGKNVLPNVQAGGRGAAVGMTLFRAALGSVAFWATVVVGIISLIGLRLRNARINQIKYNESVLDYAKYLQARIRAEKASLEEQDRLIESVKRVQKGLESVGDDVNKYSVAQVRLRQLMSKLQAQHIGYAKAVDEASRSVGNLARIEEIRSKQQIGFENITARFEAERRLVFQNARLVIETIREIEASVLRFNEESPGLRVFLDEKSAKIAVEDARKIAERVNAGLVPPDVVTEAVMGQRPVRLEAYRNGEEAGKEYLKGLARAIAKEAEDPEKSFRERISRINNEAAKIGIKLDEESFSPQRVKDWAKEVIENIDNTSLASDRMTEALLGSNNVFRDLSTQLESVARRAKATIADLFNLQLIEVIADDAGFAWGNMEKIVEQTVGKVRKATDEFTGLFLSLERGTNAVANIGATFNRFGLAFNPIIELGRKAEETIKAIADAQRRLNEIAASPSQFINQTARTIADIVDLTGDVEVVQESFKDLIREFTGKSTIEEAALKMEELLGISSDLFEVLATAPGADDFADAAFKLQEQFKKTEGTQEQMERRMKFLRKDAELLARILSRYSLPLYEALEAARRFNMELKLSKAFLEAEQAVIHSQISAYRDLANFKKASDEERRKNLQREKLALYDRAVAEAEIAFLQDKGLTALEARASGDRDLIKILDRMIEEHLRLYDIEAARLNKEYEIREVLRQQEQEIKKSQRQFEMTRKFIEDIYDARRGLLEIELKSQGIGDEEFARLSSGIAIKMAEDELRAKVHQLAVENIITKEHERQISNLLRQKLEYAGMSFNLEDVADIQAEIGKLIKENDERLDPLIEKLVRLASELELQKVKAALESIAKLFNIITNQNRIQADLIQELASGTEFLEKYAMRKQIEALEEDIELRKTQNAIAATLAKRQRESLIQLKAQTSGMAETMREADVAAGAFADQLAVTAELDTSGLRTIINILSEAHLLGSSFSKNLTDAVSEDLSRTLSKSLSDGITEASDKAADDLDTSLSQAAKSAAESVSYPYRDSFSKVARYISKEFEYSLGDVASKPEILTDVLLDRFASVSDEMRTTLEDSLSGAAQDASRTFVSPIKLAMKEGATEGAKEFESALSAASPNVRPLVDSVTRPINDGLVAAGESLSETIPLQDQFVEGFLRAGLSIYKMNQQLASGPPAVESLYEGLGKVSRETSNINRELSISADTYGDTISSSLSIGLRRAISDTFEELDSSIDDSTFEIPFKKGIGNVIRETINNYDQAVKDAASRSSKTISYPFISTFDSISKGVSSIGDSIKESITSASSDFSVPFSDSLKEATTEALDLDEAVNKVIDTTKDVNVDGLKESLDDSTTGFIKLGDLVTNVIGKVRETSSSGFLRLGTSITNVMDEVADRTSGSFIKLGGMITDVISGVKKISIGDNFKVSVDEAAYEMAGLGGLVAGVGEKAEDLSLDGFIEELDLARRGAFALDEGIVKIEQDAQKLKTTSSDSFIELQRLIKYFDIGFGGALDAIKSGFAGIPDFVTDRFQTIAELEQEIVEKQAEIINLQNQADPGAEEYAKTAQEIERAEGDLDKLNQKLDKAKSKGQALKDVFAKVALDIGDVIADVNAEILRDKLKDAVGASFGRILEKKINEFAEKGKNTFDIGGNITKTSIIEGSTIGGQIFAESIIAASGFGATTTTGGLAPGDVTSRATEIAARAREEAERTANIDTPEEVRNLNKTTDSGLKALGEAMLVMGQQIVTGFAQAMGGGGTGARTGAQLGSMLSFLAGGPATPFGAAVGAIGSIAGGLIGGAFDEPIEIDNLDDLIDVALPENTEAVERNTQELRDLRSELINAPSRFVLPAGAAGFTSAGYGTSIGSGGGSISLGAPTVNITINGSADSAAVAQIETAVNKAYANQTRRFGRRSYRG